MKEETNWFPVFFFLNCLFIGNSVQLEQKLQCGFKSQQIFLFTLENIYFQTSVSVYVEDETEDSMSVYVFFSVTTMQNPCKETTYKCVLKLIVGISQTYHLIRIPPVFL